MRALGPSSYRGRQYLLLFWRWLFNLVKALCSDFPLTLCRFPRRRYLYGLHLDAVAMAELVRGARVVSSGSSEMLASGLRCAAAPT